MADMYAGGTPKMQYDETGVYDPSKKQFLNPDGSPMAPGFQGILDMQTGQLNPGFQYQAQTLDPASLEGFQKYKGEALRTGPSAWAGIQGQMLDQQKTEALDKQGASGSGQLMQALNALGSKGSRSGAGAMVAGDISKQNMMGGQNAYKDYNSNLLKLASTDEQNRVDQLGKFSDAEAKLAQSNLGLTNQGNQINLQNSLSELGSGRDYNKFLYGEGMKKWAADRTASAMENSANGKGGKGGFMSQIMNPNNLDPLSMAGSYIGGDVGNALDWMSPVDDVLNLGGGGGGSWICTKIHKAVGGLTKEDARALFRLRRFSLKHNEGLTRAYLYEYSPLTVAMEKAGVDFKDIKWFIDGCRELVEEGKMKEAFAFYTEKIFGWISKYWPECQDTYYKKYIQTGEF